MKCKSCQRLLYDYLDEALPAERRASMEQHLERCEGCRQALGEERALSSTMSASLRRETRSLTLRADIGREVERALASPIKAAPVRMPSRTRPLLRPAMVAAAVACLALVAVFVLQEKEPQPRRAAAPAAPHPTSFIMCMATVYADDTKTDWIERRLIVEEKNGVDRYLKIIARKPRKPEEPPNSEEEEL